MDEKKVKNEELQSRRDFFKNAAKAALPILAGAVIASNPLLAASSETPMGCGYTCSRGCSGTCSGSCGYGCSGSCKGGCGGCKGACTSSCTSCIGGCKGYY